MVAEHHVLVLDLTWTWPEWPGTWCVGDFRHLVQQRKQILHVYQRLTNLAVHRAQHVERHCQLHQVGIDDDEITHGHCAIAYVQRRHGQHDGAADDHHCRLGGVQQRQAFAGEHGGVLVITQGLVQPLCFVCLVVEVAHGLEVQQGVDCAATDFVVSLIHLSPNASPPGSNGESQPYVERDSNQGDQRVGQPEQNPEDAAHQQHLDHRRHDVKGDKRQQELNAVSAPVNEAVQRTGFALQVKTD